MSPSASRKIEFVSGCGSVSEFVVFNIFLVLGALWKILLVVLVISAACDWVVAIGTDLGPLSCVAGLGHKLLWYTHSGVGFSQSVTLPVAILNKSSCLVWNWGETCPVHGFNTRAMEQA